MVTGTRFYSNKRIIRTGQPLSLDTIRHHAPAVFATEPHESRGPRYKYVPTIVPLQKMLDNGWRVYEVTQQRSRDTKREPFTKHMLRLRKAEDFDSNQTMREGVQEIILVNAHDGTAAYRLYSGYFRFICTNGLVVGDQVSSFVVYHTVGAKTADAVLEAGERLVIEAGPKMMDAIARYRATPLTREQQLQFAQVAMNLRYGDNLASFQSSELLQVRRPEDEGDDAWHVLNRIQENVVYGGWETRSWSSNRRSEVRPIERVNMVVKINVGLWNHAEKLALEAA